MSTIRCVYASPPPFPATDQHPDAVRYTVGVYIVDAIGGAPTQAEVDAVLNPSATPAARAAQNFVANRDARARSLAAHGDLAGALKLKGVI